jgi:hypothetical protein
VEVEAVVPHLSFNHTDQMEVADDQVEQIQLCQVSGVIRALLRVLELV